MRSVSSGTLTLLMIMALVVVAAEEEDFVRSRLTNMLGGFTMNARRSKIRLSDTVFRIS